MQSPLRSSCLRFSPLLLLAFTGCSNPETWEFKEEVLLNTGETVVVSRVALRNNVWPHISNDGYQSVVNQWLSVPTLGVEWESREQGSPISLGVIEGTIIVATDSGYGIEDCERRPTEYRVTFWKKTASGWSVVDQSDALLDGLTVNLLVDPTWNDEGVNWKKPFLSTDSKGSRDGIDYANPQTIRQYGEAVFGVKCATMLKLYGRQTPSPPET